MSSRRAIAPAILLLLAGLVSGGVASAAEPAANPAPLAGAKKPSPTCGELPRGSRAYRDCIAAQSRRETAGEPAVKPALSSR